MCISGVRVHSCVCVRVCLFMPEGGRSLELISNPLT